MRNFKFGGKATKKKTKALGTIKKRYPRIVKYVSPSTTTRPRASPLSAKAARMIAVAHNIDIPKRKKPPPRLTYQELANRDALIEGLNIIQNRELLRMQEDMSRISMGGGNVSDVDDLTSYLATRLQMQQNFGGKQTLRWNSLSGEGFNVKEHLKSLAAKKKPAAKKTPAAKKKPAAKKRPAKNPIVKWSGNTTFRRDDRKTLESILANLAI